MSAEMQCPGECKGMGRLMIQSGDVLISGKVCEDCGGKGVVAIPDTVLVLTKPGFTYEGNPWYAWANVADTEGELYADVKEEWGKNRRWCDAAGLVPVRVSINLVPPDYRPYKKIVVEVAAKV